MAQADDLMGLLDRARGGDGAAGADLLRRYQPLLLGLVRTCAPALPDRLVSPEDLHQEGCRQLLELLRTCRVTSPAGLSAYLRQMLGWRLANYVRAERRRRLRSATLRPAHLDLLRDELRANLGAGIENPRLRAACRQLSPKQRQVLHGIYWQDKPAREVALSLGLSEQAVTGVRRRAEARLRQELGEKKLGTR